MKIQEDKVERCCCGCSLETGTKIIAWMEIIYGISVLLSVIETGISIHHTDDKNDEDCLQTREDKCSNGSSGLETFVFYVLGTIVAIFFGVKPLVGAMKTNAQRFKTWIIEAIKIYIATCLIGTLVLVVLAIEKEQFLVAQIVFVVTVVAFLFFYCCIVAGSSFREGIIAGYNICNNVGACIFTTLLVLGISIIDYRIFGEKHLSLVIILFSVHEGIYTMGFGVVLLVGVEKTRADYVDSWVFYSLFRIVLFITCIFIAILVMLPILDVLMSAFIMIVVIISTIFLALKFCVLAIVYRFQKQLLPETLSARLQE